MFEEVCLCLSWSPSSSIINNSVCLSLFAELNSRCASVFWRLKMKKEGEKIENIILRWAAGGFQSCCFWILHSVGQRLKPLHVSQLNLESHFYVSVDFNQKCFSLSSNEGEQLTVVLVLSLLFLEREKKHLKIFIKKNKLLFLKRKN